MKRSFALAVIFSIAVAGHAFAQSAVTACVKGENGQARIVAPNVACLPSETRVQWNVAGPVGPAGPKGDPGVQGEPGPGGPFRVVDAGDQLVGVVFTATTYYPAVLKVLRTVGDFVVAFDVMSGSYSSGTASVYYSDTNCTSADRYMSIGQADFFRYGYVMAEATGQRFLVFPGGQPTPDGLALRSYRRTSVTTPGACTTLTTPITGGTLANYREVEQQLLEFDFPFRLVQQ